MYVTLWESSPYLVATPLKIWRSQLIWLPILVMLLIRWADYLETSPTVLYSTETLTVNISPTITVCSSEGSACRLDYELTVCGLLFLLWYCMCVFLCYREILIFPGLFTYYYYPANSFRLYVFPGYKEWHTYMHTIIMQHKSQASWLLWGSLVSVMVSTIAIWC